MKWSAARHRWVWTRRGNKFGPGTSRGRLAIGWMLIALSVVMVLVLRPLGEIGGFLFFQGPLDSAASEIVDVRDLPFSEGRYRRVPVYGIAYQYMAADGRTYGGESYLSAAENGSGVNRGVVEHHAAFPYISRLRGHRLTPAGPKGLLVLVPGLVGALILWTRGRSGRGARWWRLG